MTAHGSLFTGTAGEDIDVIEPVLGVTPADPLVKAWLTIKAKQADADPGVVQKVITIFAGGAGQITADGSINQGNGTASCLFHLLAADTTLLGAGTQYVFDIQVKTAGGKIYTVEDGGVLLTSRITAATT